MVEEEEKEEEVKVEVEGGSRCSWYTRRLDDLQYRGTQILRASRVATREL